MKIRTYFIFNLYQRRAAPSPVKFVKQSIHKLAFVVLYSEHKKHILAAKLITTIIIKKYVFLCVWGQYQSVNFKECQSCPFQVLESVSLASNLKSRRLAVYSIGKECPCQLKGKLSAECFARETAPSLTSVRGR